VTKRRVRRPSDPSDEVEITKAHQEDESNEQRRNQRKEPTPCLRALPQWRQASNVEIAKQIGVSEATVRRAQIPPEAGGLSSSSDEDADNAPSQTRVIHRGGQEYQMKVERIGKAQEPAAEPVPLTLEDSKRIAAADREKALKESDRYRERREKALAALTPVVDEAAIETWLKTAMDSQRCAIAIKAYNAIASKEERARVIEALTVHEYPI
jgi:hypothetical protein